MARPAEAHLCHRDRPGRFLKCPLMEARRQPGVTDATVLQPPEQPPAAAAPGNHRWIWAALAMLLLLGLAVIFALPGLVDPPREPEVAVQALPPGQVAPARDAAVAVRPPAADGTTLRDAAQPPAADNAASGDATQAAATDSAALRNAAHQSLQGYCNCVPNLNWTMPLPGANRAGARRPPVHPPPTGIFPSGNSRRPPVTTRRRTLGCSSSMPAAGRCWRPRSRRRKVRWQRMMRAPPARSLKPRWRSSRSTSVRPAVLPGAQPRCCYRADEPRPGGGIQQ